jgi:hypothetical protein
MLHSNRWVVAAVLASGIAVSGCAKSSTFDNEPAGNGGAAKIEKLNGHDAIVLSSRAQQRLGIETSRISRARVAGASRLVIPYAAVLYDASGQASTFTSPASRTFVERPIKIDFVRGGQAVLASGPPVGTSVVTVGSAELLGTARGVEEE